MPGSQRSLSVRRRERWRAKGIDPYEAEMAIFEHDGFCALCGADEPGSTKGWHVDHDHDLAPMAPVRGILCHQCNVGLGMFRDSPHLLRRAAAYLEG